MSIKDRLNKLKVEALKKIENAAKNGDTAKVLHFTGIIEKIEVL